MLSQLTLPLGVATGCNAKKVDASASAAVKPAESVAPNIVAESLWRDGQTYVYELVVSSGTGIAGALPMAQYVMHGDLVVAARKTSAGSVQLAVHVASSKFQTENVEAQPMYDALTKELSQPYLVTLSRGTIAEELIAKNTSAYAESILRYLGATLQLRAAYGHTGLEATERDLTGVYHATYDADAAGTEILRKKLRYDPVPVEGTGPTARHSVISPTVKDSKATFRVIDGTLQSVEAAESLGAPISNGTAVASSTSLKLELKRTSATVSLVPWDRLTLDCVATQPGRMVAKSTKPSQFDQLRIGDYTFEKALSELTQSATRHAKKSETDALTPGRPTPQDVATQKSELTADERVFSAMTALLRRDVANVDRAVQLIMKRSVAEAQLLDALSSAGTPAAQQALVRIMENPTLDKTRRIRSAVALSRVANASPDTVGAFSRLIRVDGFRTAACYGLGTLSRRLRENGDFVAADSIVDTLVAELKNSRSEDSSVVALRGIANSGNSKAFDTVEPFLKEPSRRLREAAVESIRLMSEPRVETVLLSALANETDQSIRVAALDACGMRDMSPELLRTVTSVGISDKSSRVRQHALQVLATWAPRHSEAAAALKSVAALEANPNVQREAESAAKYVGK